MLLCGRYRDEAKREDSHYQAMVLPMKLHVILEVVVSTTGYHCRVG